MFFEKLSHNSITHRVRNAIKANRNYDSELVLGVPATYLDREEFYPDAPFLKTAPFLSALIANPNHIGCHTLEDDHGEAMFAGTQEIERELIGLCAEQIFQGKKGQQDGYVAPGGTEANIQAMWVFRNYFQIEMSAKKREIGVVYSEDAHYSMPKGCNLLGLKSYVVPVHPENRQMQHNDIRSTVQKAKQEGVKHLIVVLNMATTMFGSVDKPEDVLPVIKESGLGYLVHVDAAFGGFIYPFTHTHNTLHFGNPEITSISLDGHKMLQTPYGTGIFLIRKGFMHFTQTKEAQYVQGTDFTLCGSRSGANAISIWMILMIHGSAELKVKMISLMHRTLDLKERLEGLGLNCFWEEGMNILTIHSQGFPRKIAEKYYLVPDNWDAPKWWKIVVMDHVGKGVLDHFIRDLEGELA